MQIAHDAAEHLRRERLAVNFENLRGAVILAAGSTLPRSAVVIDLTDVAVMKLVDFVVGDYLRVRMGR